MRTGRIYEVRSQHSGFYCIIPIPGMKTYIIPLEEHDDLLSIQDKMSWGKTGRILLVWQTKGRVLTRRIDLLLLQRHAQHLGAQIALVTRNAFVKEQAHSLGILVFADTIQAQQRTWRRLRRKPVGWLSHSSLPPETLRMQQVSLLRRPAQKRWLDWLLFPVGVLAFLSLVLFFAPGANVRLMPQRKVQTVNLALFASPDVPTASASGRVPAYPLLVEGEGSLTVASSGQTALAAGFANGEVQLTNLTDQVVSVSQGSVLRSTDEPTVRFNTMQSVEIPAGPGTQASVAIRALYPGVDGNVPVGVIQSLEGPEGAALQVENLQATRGGTDRFSPAPTAQDYRLVKGELLEDLRANAQTEAHLQSKPGQVLLEKTLHVQSILSESQQPLIGQPGDHLQLTMRVQYEVWYVEETDLRAVAQAALTANPLPGFRAVNSSLRWEFLSEPALRTLSDSTPDTVNASDAVSASGQAAEWEARVEQTYEASWENLTVIQSIQGQDIEEARHTLQNQLALAQPPDIALTPSWWHRLPYLPARISLVKQ